jgi:hypothetical protein
MPNFSRSSRERRVDAWIDPLKRLMRRLTDWPLSGRPATRCRRTSEWRRQNATRSGARCGAVHCSGLLCRDPTSRERGLNRHGTTSELAQRRESSGYGSISRAKRIARQRLAKGKIPILHRLEGGSSRTESTRPRLRGITDMWFSCRAAGTSCNGYQPTEPQATTKLNIAGARSAATTS